MHTAGQLDKSMFDVKIRGQASTREALLPRWQPHDRLGVIVHDPLGGVGASLLVQIAITAFYDARPGRRRGRPIYPEIYLFHVGGQYGNYGYFDYWPPRKEVFVDNKPASVLSSVNERGISRLLVPDRDPSTVDHDRWERSAAEDRILSAFAYSAGGRVRNADVEVYGTDPRTESNPTLTLHPDRAVARIRASRGAPAREGSSADAGVNDRRLFEELLVARIDEVPPDVRRIAARLRDQISENGVVMETYRRISVGEALGLLVKPASDIMPTGSAQLPERA
jgi:hypothetical protein